MSIDQPIMTLTVGRYCIVHPADESLTTRPAQQEQESPGTSSVSESASRPAGGEGFHPSHTAKRVAIPVPLTIFPVSTSAISTVRLHGVWLPVAYRTAGALSTAAWQVAPAVSNCSEIINPS